MDYQLIKVEKSGHISKISFNRPDALNALNKQTRFEFQYAMADVSKDEEIKVVIVTGKGRAFMAGADINELKSTSPLEAQHIVRLGELIEQCPKPVIAMVNGYCLGGGCEIMLACDIIIASDEAKFGQPEINLGLIPGGGGTQRLPLLVGIARAKELILTGDIIDAYEAERIGLINKVISANELEATVYAMANKLASKSSIALMIAKLAINHSQYYGLGSGLAYERSMYSLSLSTQDKEEGINAFLEKREAEFKGK